MHKKALLLCFTGIIFFSIITQAEAAEQVKIRLNQYYVLYTDSERSYYIDPENNRLMVPMSMLSKMLGINYVGYDRETKMYVFTQADHELKLAVGERFALLDGEKVTLKAVPVRKEGVIESMYVPICVLIDAFGYDIEWIHEWKELRIYHDELMTSRQIDFLLSLDQIGYGWKKGHATYIENPFAFRVVSYSLKQSEKAEDTMLFTLQNITGKDLEGNKYMIYRWQGPGGGQMSEIRDHMELPFVKEGGLLESQTGVSSDYVILWPRSYN